MKAKEREDREGRKEGAKRVIINEEERRERWRAGDEGREKENREPESREFTDGNLKANRSV